MSGHIATHPNLVVAAKAGIRADDRKMRAARSAVAGLRACLVSAHTSVAGTMGPRFRGDDKYVDAWWGHGPCPM